MWSTRVAARLGVLYRSALSVVVRETVPPTGPSLELLALTAAALALYAWLACGHACLHRRKWRAPGQVPH